MTHTNLGITLLAKQEMIQHMTGSNDETRNYITHDGDAFVALSINEGLVRVELFETFSCCVAYLHGGLSEAYLNTYDEQNENDTDENLTKYREMQYAFVIDTDGVPRVVSFEQGNSFDFINDQIRSVFGCFSPRGSETIDIYHDDEFLLRSDISKQVPTLLVMTERRTNVDYTRDVIFFGKLVIVSSNEEGETIGMHDNAVVEFVDSLNRFTLTNQFTGEKTQALVSMPTA